MIELATPDEQHICSEVIQKFNLGLDSNWPESLHHYTSQTGFKGIIEKQCIWATHIRYLNDVNEFENVFEIAKHVIQGYYAGHFDAVKRVIPSLSNYKDTNICVCSFSGKRDDLSQWRAYSRNQIGYSIGFKPNKLNDICLVSGHILVKCEYEYQNQYEIIKAAIDMAFQLYDGNDERLIQAIKIALCVFGPICKHKSFRDENEFRIITNPIRCTDDSFEYREGASSLIPYYKINLTNNNVPENIAGVIIGPTPEPKIAKMAANSLILKYWEGKRGYQQNDLAVNSVIPYRTWH